MTKHPVLTVGYERLVPEQLLDAVQRHEVRAVIDIRTVATSRQPSFEGDALAETLGGMGVAYVHEPDLGDMEEPDGRLPDDAVRRVELMAARGPLMVLCKEESPVHCRRALLAARLAQRGHPVVHLGVGGGTNSVWDGA